MPQVEGNHSGLEWQSVVESAPNAFVMADAEGRIVLINARTEKLFGYPREELIGRPVEMLIPERSRDLHRGNRRQYMADPQARLMGVGRDLWGKRKDGSEVPVEIGLSPIQTEKGTMVLASIVDISERKRAEQMLRESEERLNAFLRHLPGAAWIKDFDGRYLYANPEGERIFGISLEELRGKADEEIFPPATARQFRENDRRVLAEGVSVETTEVLRQPDGVDHYSIVHKFVLPGSAGQPASIAGVAFDITDRKQAEEELEAARQSAEQAKAIAEQASRAKDHFLAVLSHELRTPLTPVVMGLSILQKRSDLATEVRETLELVHRHVELEARLIDDLLDITRIEHGKIELQKQRMQLCTVIRRTVDVCQPEIDARGLRLDVHLGPTEACLVEGDGARLQQVFWNLLQNAAKFTPHGGRVGVRCTPKEKVAVVEVSDSGIGMEPEALSRVFNAFEQADRSVTRQFGGLGLGLAISKALVEMHGGTISARSQGRDKGATFCVHLPLAKPADQHEEITSAAAPHRTPCPLRILLVEDHSATAKMLRLVLTSAGHAVEVAGDVATALDLAGRHSFDLLVSDLGLPDGNGHALMRQLRQCGYRFPGIALSGYGQAEDIRRSLEAGFSAHLTKPASRQRIIEAVASAAGVQPTSP